MWYNNRGHVKRTKKVTRGKGGTKTYSGSYEAVVGPATTNVNTGETKVRFGVYGIYYMLGIEVDVTLDASESEDQGTGEAQDDGTQT